jgi:antitoxin component YwqK of YwqJK toxin-antitoxin module
MTRALRDTGPVGDRPENVLDIAEIPYESGEIHHRYSRYMSVDGTRWVRHGLFVGYHQNGQTKSEGQYVDGLEEGTWRDYYENGQIAAEGCYFKGKEQGYWRFWSATGTEEPPVEYLDGEEVA